MKRKKILMFFERQTYRNKLINVKNNFKWIFSRWKNPKLFDVKEKAQGQKKYFNEE